jgi:peptidoglycan/LPS O-acetylase OafA/YrhL
VLIVGIAFYARFYALPDELQTIRYDGIWTVLYGANWRAVLAGSNYWAIFSAPSPLQHTWSLAIEEQFYLLWPLIVFAAARWRPHRAAARVFTTAIATATLSAVWMIVSYDPANSSRAYFGTDTRIASILWGAALAALIAWKPSTLAPRRVMRRAVAVTTPACVALLGVMWVRLDGQDVRLYRGGFLLAGLSAVLIIYTILAAQSRWLIAILSWPPLRLLGKLSYGAYLYHWPIFVILHPERAGINGYPLTALRISVTLLAAGASYQWIEQPIRHGHGISWRWVARASTAATIALAALMLATANGHALINPNDGRIESIQSALIQRKQQPNAPRVMLTGSSIAALLKEPLRAAIGLGNVIVVNRASIGCAFPDGATRIQFPGSPPQSAGRPCGETWSADVRAFAPQAVLFIPGRAPRGDAVEVKGKFLRACTQEFDALYQQSLRNHIIAMRRSETTVYLATFPYQLGRHNEIRWPDTTDCVNDAIRTVARSEPGSKLIDIAAHLCAQRTKCIITSQGEPIRPDGLHFHGKGATITARWLLSEMGIAVAR